jgi:hypothetical protein
MSDNEDDNENYEGEGEDDDYEPIPYEELTFDELIISQRDDVNSRWHYSSYDSFENKNDKNFNRDNCLITVANENTYLEIMGFYCKSAGINRGGGNGIKLLKDVLIYLKIHPDKNINSDMSLDDIELNYPVLAKSIKDKIEENNREMLDKLTRYYRKIGFDDTDSETGYLFGNISNIVNKIMEQQHSGGFKSYKKSSKKRNKKRSKKCNKKSCKKRNKKRNKKSCKKQ